LKIHDRENPRVWVKESGSRAFCAEESEKTTENRVVAAVEGSCSVTAT
jgi:hypothetical protein